MKCIYLTALIVMQLWAAPGCLDNSCHLTCLFDYKNYHPVACNCPCEKEYTIMAKRAQCSKCLHFRDPHYTAIMQDDQPQPLCLKMPAVEQEPAVVVGFPKQLLQKY